MYTQNSSQVTQTSKDLEQYKKNVEMTHEYDQQNNKNYQNNFIFFFETGLLDEDIQTLDAMDRTTLNFNILRPYLLHSLKNVRDSIPSARYQTVDEEKEDEQSQLSYKDISTHLTDLYEAFLERNQYQDKVYDAAMNSFIGGKGIWKVKMEYENTYDFQQKLTLQSINPTKVFFDPSATKPTKSDARFAFELFEMPEDQIKDEFPTINIQKLEEAQAQTIKSFEWVVTDKSNRNKILRWVDYYYVKKIKRTLYELNSGKIVHKSPKNKSRIKVQRIIEDTEVWMQRMAGDTPIEKPIKTVFKMIPFIMIKGESYINNNHKEIFVPYGKHGFDAQRFKNFMGNFYMYEAVNNRSQVTWLPEEGKTNSVEEVMRDPTKAAVGYYKMYANVGGNWVQLNAPIDKPAMDLPEQYMQVFDQLDKTLQESLGAQFPSLDETNMSGKALYNLSAYISSSNEIFMHNLFLATEQLAKLVLDSFEHILNPKIINVIIPQYQNQEGQEIPKAEKKAEMQYLLEWEKFHVVATRGVNHKLQQEATIEKIIDYGKISPLVEQFLNTPEVVKLVFSNLDLNQKDKLLSLFDKFAEQKEDSPAAEMEEKMAEQKLQNDTTIAKSRMMDSHTRQIEAGVESVQKAHNQQMAQMGNEVAMLKIKNEDQRNANDIALERDKLNVHHHHFLKEQENRGIIKE